MSSQLQRRLFTVKEYHQMFEIGILTKDDRVELIEGEIIQMPESGIDRTICVKQLLEIFRKLPEDRAIIDVKNPLQLSVQTELQPDLVLLKNRDREFSLYTEASEVLLLIEIIDSTVDNDRTIKIPIYARSTVPEVWLIDLVENRWEVYRQPTPNGYSLILDLRQSQEIAPIAFPDFAVNLDAILRTINK